jgi:two-component system nitrogen regulation sensor histidine kinase GlnL
MPRDLRHVLEAILAGVIVVDAGGRVEEMNTAACRLLGRSKDSTLGSPAEDLLGPRHALARLGRKVLATGASASESDQRVRRRLTGEELEVDVAASPLFDDAGRLDGAVVVLRDRSVQSRLERLEEERERYAAFGRIAAGLAHEVKNPLGGIRGAGELLARAAQEPRARETAELVVREATRIATLLDDFMLFARGDRLELAPVNLHEVLDGVLDLLALDPVSTGCKVTRLFDPSIPELLADADRLTQVFLNLARNALQAVQPTGGELTITTRMTLDHRLPAGRGGTLPTLVVSLRDSGPGMAPEVLEQAKLPFFTTRPGGTGLGLGVAEYWISQHGGVLNLESAPGRGTEAHVTLPLRRPA